MADEQQVKHTPSPTPTIQHTIELLRLSTAEVLMMEKVH